MIARNTGASEHDLVLVVEHDRADRRAASVRSGRRRDQRRLIPARFREVASTRTKKSPGPRAPDLIRTQRYLSSSGRRTIFRLMSGPEMTT